MAVMLRGQKKPTALCEQYPLLKRDEKAHQLFSDSKIRTKFWIAQKKIRIFLKKMLYYTKKAGIVQTPALSIRLECHCFGKSITISSLNIPVTFIGGMIMPLKGVPSVLQ